MYKVYLLKYSNYFNRRIKRESAINGYIENGTQLATLENFNFVHADGIKTTLIANYDGTIAPDYCVVCNTDENTTIDSRWFIIDSDKTRKGQSRFYLKRDILSDDQDGLYNSIMSIERCQLEDTNELIYNSENFNFSEVKRLEVPIYDRTGCPWIVGYLANDNGVSNTITTALNYDIDHRNMNHTEWQYYSLLGTFTSEAQIARTQVNVTWNDFWGAGHVGYFMTQTPVAEGLSQYGQIGTNYINFECSSKANLETVANALRHTWIDWTALNNKLKEMYQDITDNQRSDLLYYNGKKVLFKDGVYSISMTDGVQAFRTIRNEEDDITEMFLDSFNSHMPSGTSKKQSIATYDFLATTSTLTMSKSESGEEYQYTIPSASNKLVDAPYKMFCMPYPNATQGAPSVLFTKADASGTHYANKDLNLSIAMDIIRNTVTSSGSSNLYDIQILPYCPMDFTYNGVSNGVYSLALKSNWISGKDYSDITHTYTDSSGKTWTEIVGQIFFPTESTFNFSVDKRYSAGRLHDIKDCLRVSNIKKERIETEKVRLCASNYSAVFEMNEAKNEGISQFNISCTYKPYNPYIQVSPNFGGLYGRNFDDNRGLICAGDYSLPIVNNAWVEFELNNKTYQQSFNREITHMEVGNEIARENALIGSIVGTAQGTAAGAVAGSMIGGPIGTAIGATVGGVASGVGGIIDYNNLTKQQGEDISYRKDLFNYNLQNIKALPNTLTKTSSLIANNKYVPFAELYSCTFAELWAFNDYIRFNGMTAGYVGQITTSGYVKASILHYNGNMSVNEVNLMNEELMKGVYLK